MKKEYYFGGSRESLKCRYSDYDCFVIDLQNTHYGSPCTFVKILFSQILLLFFKNILTAVIINTSSEQSWQTGQMLALKYFEFKGSNSVVQFLKK